MTEYSGEFETVSMDLDISSKFNELYVSDNPYNLEAPNIVGYGEFRSAISLRSLLTNKLEEGQILVVYIGNLDNLGYRISSGQCAVIALSNGILRIPKKMNKQPYSEFNQMEESDNLDGVLEDLINSCKSNLLSEFYKLDLSRPVHLAQDNMMKFLIIAPEDH